MTTDAFPEASAAPKPQVLHPGQMASYAPANHVGTSNCRIVGPETVAARYMEVLVGTIMRGGRGLPHAHPALEQVGIVTAGRARSILGGIARELQAGDIDFIPKNVFHSAQVVSDEPLELIVIYSPPYLESAAARVLEPETSAREVRVPPVIALPPVDATRAAQGGCSLKLLVDAAGHGARHLEIAHLCLGAGGSYDLSAEHAAERLVILRAGSVSFEGAVGECLAEPDDWVFIPAQAACTLHAARDGVDALLVTARSEPARAA